MHAFITVAPSRGIQTHSRLPYPMAAVKKSYRRETKQPRENHPGNPKLQLETAWYGFPSSTRRRQIGLATETSGRCTNIRARTAREMARSCNFHFLSRNRPSARNKLRLTIPPK